MQFLLSICVLFIGLGCFTSARTVNLTYYWIAFEDDFPAGSEHVLRSCTGGTLATISQAYWAALHLECSGRLRTGEYINGGDTGCNCFMRVRGPFGPKGNRLRPYISMAANDIPFGTKVFVRQLNGTALPNGKVHNGCVRVDDVGWTFGNNRIDLYVLQKSNAEKLSTYVNDHVDISENSNCTLQRYSL